MNRQDTIAAIATPPGEGGVAIIRISGKRSLEIAKKVFSRDPYLFKSHTAYFGKILDAGVVIDEGMMMPLLGKKSYTGEETVEIFCHGGSLISRKVLQAVLTAGARGALPGEFTFRAFMNGKIDLSQAEAVQELIHAKNERMLEAAKDQLQGKLSQLVAQMQSRLNLVAAILEAWVDFPDEGLEFEPMEKVIQDLETDRDRLIHLVKTFHEGRIIHEGLKVTLIGAPNVGKSSLMNALLSKDRAIVSPIAGTTRDIVQDQLRLSGLNVLLTDTAGIRETEEVIEKEGIKRSRKALEEADLIFLVLDAGRPLDKEDLTLLETLPKDKSVVVWNKEDLKPDELPKIEFPHVVSVSALNKTNIDQLIAMIDEVIWKEGSPSKEEIVITQIRHKEALEESAAHLQTVIEGLKNDVSPEFIAFDMRQALESLSRVIGANVGEDILSAIFNKFCIGK